MFRSWGGEAAAFFAYTHWSHDVCISLIVPLMPFIKSDLELSYLQSGLIFSAFAITSGLSQFIGGWVGDRISRRVVVAIGLGGIGVATMAVGLTSAYYPLLIILIIMGIFSGAYHPSILSLLSTYFSIENKGKVVGLYMVGGSLGFAMGPLLGGLISDRLSWQSAFIIFSIPALVSVPLVLRRFRKDQGTIINESITNVSIGNKVTEMQVGKNKGIGQILRPIAAIFILAVLTQLVIGSAMAFLPMYLVDKHALSSAYAAMAMGVLRGGGIAGSLFGGWLSDRWCRREAIILALVTIGPILYLLTRLPVNAFFMLVLLVFGIVWIMRQSTVQIFLMDHTPIHMKATVFGIYFGLSMESMTLVQPLVGYFMDIYGVEEAFHFMALISVVLSLFALLLIRPRFRPSQSP
ncbi:MFS transporter [Chloroflexota bacterium]